MIRCSTILHHHSRPSSKFKVPLLLNNNNNSHSYGGIGLKVKPNTGNSNFFSPLRDRDTRSESRRRRWCCRAVFTDDAPFAAAIGACMLTSLVFPDFVPREDEEAITSTDARFAVMGIVSFIPYFNWLSWVFAWLDTGKRRYAVYSLVYLAPYLRSNLSLSPEESWLPIASILFCIVHIQLEASIRNGDIEGFQIFRKTSDKLSSSTEKKGRLNQHQDMSEGSDKEKKNLPSAQEQSRDIGGWEDSQRPLRNRQHLNEDLDDDDEGEGGSKH